MIGADNLRRLFDGRVKAEKRAKVRTPFGLADKTYCPSCGVETGVATVGTPAVWVVCEACVKHPLPTTCATCNALAPSTTREAKPGEIWICEPCFEAAGAPPPGYALSVERK